MKVSGFTFIKDAIKYDYPILEAILSILPICDEMIVAVGKSEDESRKLIESIASDKIKIIDTIWDDSLREGGQVLAKETDKAFAAISPNSTWAFYIQGDEVVHENYLEEIKNKMLKYKDVPEVDGLLFKYLHFYGSYDYVGTSSNWYKNEIRVIKNHQSIFSYRDAQGFRKGNNEKLNVVPIDAYMYHYGWVKEPKAMQKKQENFNKYWHDDEWVKKNVEKGLEYEYEKHVSALSKYEGDHPEVMKVRINGRNWNFEHDISYSRLSLKDFAKNMIYRLFGIDLNYKNYKVVKKGT